MSGIGNAYDDEDLGTTLSVRPPGGSIPAETVQKHVGALHTQLSNEMNTNDKLINSFNSPDKPFDPRASARAYDDMAQRIRERSIGPSRAEKLLAVSAALSQPTKYSGFGAMFSNLSPALADILERQRTAGYAQQDVADQLHLKSMGADSDAYQSAVSNRTKLLEIAARQAAAEMHYGAPAPKAQSGIVAQAVAAYPNDPAKQREFILKNSPAAVKGISSTKPKDATSFNTPHASEGWRQ